MSRLLTGLAAAVFIFIALPVARVAATSTIQPNIVVFYLDDTAAHDGRLWNDPSLTPNIYNLFVAHGLHFTNAFGETPLCCPSRATLFTGQHTQNHGVLINDGKLFNPSETIAKEMKKSGYATMIAGKYLNKSWLFTAADWARHAAGWNYMDVFDNNLLLVPERYFYHYDIHHTDGTVTHYDDEHSTRFVAEDTIARMRQVPPEQPIFSVMSIFNTHDPNIPMPEFINDPRCAAMPPWDPPNYNEADVSDKPAYVRSHRLLRYTAGWPMTTFCREMLGVDWLVGQTVNELTAEGRLDNTLFLFTSDNGMTWGEHRLPQSKGTPYSTPIPLYMSWSAGFGTTPHNVDEFVSDIDLAPTMCAVAGCTLGPFPNGQLQPDGLNLLPMIQGVLDGVPVHLGRDAILQSNFHLPWWGLRTTSENPLGLWTYTEWANGDLELYNMTTDPYEMQNLAYNPAYLQIRQALAQRLVLLKNEGRENLPASITIVEDSLPNGPQDFSYTGSVGLFSLDDDTNGTLPRKRVFSNLTPGTFTVTETPTVNWALTGITCPRGVVVNLLTGTAQITVTHGDSVTCTFSNARLGPDLSIGLATGGPFKGGNIYYKLPNSKQTVRRDAVTPGFPYDYYVNVQNDGPFTDSFAVDADVSTTSSMIASFWSGGFDRTASILDGSFTTPAVPPGQSVVIHIQVLVSADAARGAQEGVVVTATSVGHPTAIDVVRAFTTAGSAPPPHTPTPSRSSSVSRSF